MQSLMESRRAFRACRLSTSQARAFHARVLQATGVAGAGLMLGIALPLGGRLAMAQDNRQVRLPANCVHSHRRGRQRDHPYQQARVGQA